MCVLHINDIENLKYGKTPELRLQALTNIAKTPKQNEKALTLLMDAFLLDQPDAVLAVIAQAIFVRVKFGGLLGCHKQKLLNLIQQKPDGVHGRELLRTYHLAVKRNYFVITQKEYEMLMEVIKNNNIYHMCDSLFREMSVLIDAH